MYLLLLIIVLILSKDILKIAFYKLFDSREDFLESITYFFIPNSFSIKLDKNTKCLNHRKKVGIFLTVFLLYVYGNLIISSYLFELLGKFS
ncbi:MAG: hypothetical protein ACQEQE_07595 [Bacillota bacterium]